MCAFIVTTCALKTDRPKWRARVPVDSDNLQPLPREVWGVDIPLKPAMN